MTQTPEELIARNVASLLVENARIVVQLHAVTAERDALKAELAKLKPADAPKPVGDDSKAFARRRASSTAPTGLTIHDADATGT